MWNSLTLLQRRRRYLDVDKQLQKVSGRHDDGGVKRDDVALVQIQVQVGGQPLRHTRQSKTNMQVFLFSS